MDIPNSDPTGAVKYRGVRKRAWGKYVSEIRLPHSRERIWLGSYDTAEKAARAFDAAMYCLRGNDATAGARFNFPDQVPDHIPRDRVLTHQEIRDAAAEYANQKQQSDEGGAVPIAEYTGTEQFCEEASPDGSSQEFPIVPDDNIYWTFQEFEPSGTTSAAGFPTVDFGGSMLDDEYVLPPQQPPQSPMPPSESGSGDRDVGTSFLWSFDL